MKKCEKCQNEYEQGNFCKACGGKLIDFTIDDPVVKDPKENLDNSQAVNENEPEIINEEEPDVISDPVRDEKSQEIEEPSTVMAPDGSKDDQVIEPPRAPIVSDTLESKEEAKVQEEAITKEEAILKSDDDPKKVKNKKKNKEAKKEGKKKEKKEKKKRSWFKRIFMILLFLLIGLLVFAGYYMNQSQIDLSDSDDFDPVAFERNLLEEHFDGETFSFESDQEAISFYLNRWFSENQVKSPFNLEITGIGYDAKRDLVLINLDKQLIHTSLGLNVSMTQEDDLLKLEIKKASLGKWHLPLSKDYVLSTFDLPVIFDEGVEMPGFISLSNYKTSKEGVEIEAVLDLEYFKDMFLDSFNNLADYYDYGISYNEEGQRMDGFYSMRDFWQKEEAKLFLKNISTNETFLITYLSLLDPQYAETMVESFVSEALYIRDESLDRIISAYTSQSAAIVDEHESYTENTERNIYLNSAKDLSNAYYQAYETENKEDIISIKDRPFYLTWGLFLDDDFRSIYETDLIYDVFYMDGFTLFGIETPYGYLVFENENTYEWYDDASDFDALNDYDINFYFEQGEWLRSGDPERTAIEAAISYYEGYAGGAWINFMTVASDNAYVLAAEKGNSQILQQYTLTKLNGEWSVHNVYGTDVSNLDIALEYRDVYQSLDYNISLLPYFDITDYYVWYYTPEEIGVIVDYLVENGYVGGDVSANYFRRIDNFAYIGFVDESKFVFEFEPDSTDNYVNFLIIEKDDTIENYYYDIFGESDYEFWPIFLWIQP